MHSYKKKLLELRDDCAVALNLILRNNREKILQEAMSKGWLDLPHPT